MLRLAHAPAVFAEVRESQTPPFFRAESSIDRNLRRRIFEKTFLDLRPDSAALALRGLLIPCDERAFDRIFRKLRR